MRVLTWLDDMPVNHTGALAYTFKLVRENRLNSCGKYTYVNGYKIDRLYVMI